MPSPPQKVKENIDTVIKVFTTQWEKENIPVFIILCVFYILTYRISVRITVTTYKM